VGGVCKEALSCPIIFCNCMCVCAAVRGPPHMKGGEGGRERGGRERDPVVSASAFKPFSPLPP